MLPCTPLKITSHIQSEEKGSENYSGSLTSKPPLFKTFAIWPALQSHKYQDSQAQEQFLAPGNLHMNSYILPPLCNKYMCNTLLFICYHLLVHPCISLYYSYSSIYWTTVYIEFILFFCLFFLFIFTYMCLFLFLFSSYFYCLCVVVSVY